MPSSLLLTRHKAYAVLTLNRPSRLNRLTTALMDELSELLSTLSETGDLFALIVTGAGGVFSAGADLGEVAALTPTTAFDFSRKGQSILASIGDAAPVSIAAIDGHCLGGGLDLAMSCDLRFATAAASFQHPGARRGIITGWGGTQRLPRIVGIDAAYKLLVTGDRIDAAEALRIGLINKICDDPLDSARRLAESVSTKFTREQLLDIRRQIVGS
jgi:enoyl-CoA hydratase